MLVLSSDEVAAEGPLEVAVEDELSTEARELVSDLVGLPPTFGFCCGGLGGGALGLDGLVVAIEAGLFIEIFLADEIAPGAAVAPTGKSEGFTEEARPPPLAHCTRRGHGFDLGSQPKFLWNMKIRCKCYQKIKKLK